MNKHFLGYSHVYTMCYEDASMRECIVVLFRHVISEYLGCNAMLDYECLYHCGKEMQKVLDREAPSKAAQHFPANMKSIHRISLDVHT